MCLLGTISGMEPDDSARRMIAARLRLGTPEGLSDDVCWPWLGGSTHEKGYGVISYTMEGQHFTILASRAVAALRGDMPFRGRKHNARHSCDNPPCINPAHIVPGTPKDNTADMLARGRRVQPRVSPTRVEVLTDDQVRAIRKDTRPAREVAKDHGTCESNVWMIRSRKRKAGVPD